jgi:hypothetical protein
MAVTSTTRRSPTRKQSADDFDPSDELKISNEFKRIDEKINALELKNQPYEFAEIFCSAASSQLKIEEIINEKIVKAIKTDQSTKEAIKFVIDDYSKSKIYWAIGAIIVFILGLSGNFLMRVADRYIFSTNVTRQIQPQQIQQNK